MKKYATIDTAVQDAHNKIYLALSKVYETLEHQSDRDIVGNGHHAAQHATEAVMSFVEKDLKERNNRALKPLSSE